MTWAPTPIDRAYATWEDWIAALQEDSKEIPWPGVAPGVYVSPRRSFKPSSQQRDSRPPERAKAAAVHWTRRELFNLHALVLQAWELRKSPYLIDASRAIVDWHERRHLADLEREQAFEAAWKAAQAVYPNTEGRRP
jgi:hypothetical protein